MRSPTQVRIKLTMVQHNAYIVQHVSEEPNWRQTRTATKPLHYVEEPSFVLKSVSTYVKPCM